MAVSGRLLRQRDGSPVRLKVRLLRLAGRSVLAKAVFPFSIYFAHVREKIGQATKREVKSMFEDKTLVCKECGNEFVFTAGEQEFYAERGFQNEPQRCKACRDARKNAARAPREFFTATCAACGREARVPFEPKTDRPVYCSECFAKMRENG